MKRFLRGFAIFLALVGVGIISAFAVVALLLRQEEVRVPDLTGQDLVSVIDVLAQQGLQIKVDRREPSQAMPRDTVISQTPAPGNGIKKGRQVYVVLSLGPSDLQAPKLVGEHFRRADIMMRQAGFFPGFVARISSPDVERDLVIAQVPQPGIPFEKGGKINILVSTGKQAEKQIMPALIGKKAEEAVRIIDRMKLQHRVAYKTSEDKAPAVERTVIHQKPGAGSPIAPDGVVDIIVSK
jgi:serine/threonine-protein kinase